MLKILRIMTIAGVAAASGAAGLTSPALAAGRTIGTPFSQEGMAIVVRYIQSVEMDGVMHAGHNANGKPGDLHLETVITATEDNPYGFTANAFVPYLRVEYVLRKEGSDWVGDGVLQAMMANDGAHYATNASLDGPGKYVMELTVAPPSAEVFPRHIDTETGAREWWTPFTVDLPFTFVGSVGKKGGY